MSDEREGVLEKIGLYGRVAAKKPYLNKLQIRKRIAFCQAYKHWNDDMWQNVVFMDEARIEMKPQLHEYVRRPLGKRFWKLFITETVKFGGGSITVWGAIKANGDRMLVKCQGMVGRFC